MDGPVSLAKLALLQLAHIEQVFKAATGTNLKKKPSPSSHPYGEKYKRRMDRAIENIGNKRENRRKIIKKIMLYKRNKNNEEKGA